MVLRSVETLNFTPLPAPLLPLCPHTLPPWLCKAEGPCQPALLQLSLAGGGSGCEGAAQGSCCSLLELRGPDHMSLKHPPLTNQQVKALKHSAGGERISEPYPPGVLVLALMDELQHMPPPSGEGSPLLRCGAVPVALLPPE